MSRKRFIVFVCEHGAAKSVVAAAYFNILASDGNHDVHAIARGTTPEAEFSPKAVEGLQRDGLTPLESAPQMLKNTEVESAQRIVTFCELPEEYQGKADVERWDGVPPVSEGYEKARDAIVEKINRFMNSL